MITRQDRKIVATSLENIFSILVTITDSVAQKQLTKHVHKEKLTIISLVSLIVSLVSLILKTVI